jgi:hypothetical protein
LLDASYAKTASLDVLNAIVTLRKAQGEANTGALFAKHLEREPSLVAATQWIANEKFEHEEFHPQVQRALERAAGRFGKGRSRQTHHRVLCVRRS